MSTTFGVKVPSQEDIVSVAFRGNGGYFYFTKPLAELLPDDTKVIAMDNSPQGIFTIGDIKNEINKRISTNQQSQ